MTEATIFARASGSGRAAIAVVRLSGPACAEVLQSLTGHLPKPRVASLASLRDPRSGDILDQALILWFPAPKSFTGEDAAELHLHGGRAVVDGVLRALSHMDGLRPAGPGEFTRRAYRNGKMDLTAVEGLADLIDAETETQRRQALRQFDGVLGTWAASLRSQLIEALALTEACIDFADEDDLVAGFDAELRQRVDAVASGIAAQLALAERGEKLREGIVVTIAGPPNVGKSTLLNSLAGRDVAIVSAFAGTTRDAIEVELDLNGQAVRLIDTAGLRDTDDPIEQEGISRARAKAESADLVLWLDDTLDAPSAKPPVRKTLWTIRTKADRHPHHGTPVDFHISAKTGAGIGALVTRLTAFASHRLEGAETALVTRLRHRQALETASRHLSRVTANHRGDAELIAEDLRLAIAALADLVGLVDVEEVLGSIFARFCIGK